MSTTSAEARPHVSTEYIEITPGVCGGKPRIAGHRIKVQHVAVWHERLGKTAQQIVAEYPTLTLAEVHAALAYYYDHREQIDADIRAGEEFAEQLQPAPPPYSRSWDTAMARTIRFHLDEHCPTALAEGLRRHGIDTTMSAEVGLFGAQRPGPTRLGLVPGPRTLHSGRRFLAAARGRHFSRGHRLLPPADFKPGHDPPRTGAGVGSVRARGDAEPCRVSMTALRILSPSRGTKNDHFWRWFTFQVGCS